MVLIGLRQLRDQAVINCNAFSTEMIFFLKMVILIRDLFTIISW